MFVNWHFRAAEGSLHWTQRWCRVHGLALHFPFSDDDLCDFELQLPRDSISTEKEDLRRLAEQFMPRDMAWWPKLPQTVPISRWFRGPLQSFLRDRLSPALIARSGLFDNKVVQQAIDAHVRGRADHGWKLWALLTVVAWQELVASRDLAVAESPVCKSGCRLAVAFDPSGWVPGRRYRLRLACRLTGSASVSHPTT
jgi:hypothetical protein